MLPGHKSASRFYKEVSVETSTEGNRVLLDGRPLRTPLRAELRLPTPALAKAIAEEWERQGDKIDAAAMPMMALACTALDRIALNRAAMEESLLAYGGNDLLCYWADGPEPLLERQRGDWQPLLDWAADELGVALSVSVGVVHRPQSKEALQRLSEILAELDDFQFAAVSSITAATNSLLIGLALLRGRVDAESAFSAAELDGLYQQEFWGVDAEAKAIQSILLKEIQEVIQFIQRIRFDKN